MSYLIKSMYMFASEETFIYLKIRLIRNRFLELPSKFVLPTNSSSGFPKSSGTNLIDPAVEHHDDKDAVSV